jgi:two-component system, NtrC family, sensor kinase
MDLSPINILVVEDDDAHASAIRRALRASGMKTEITVVGTLQEFRDSAARKVPDVAIMDLNLPDGRAVDALTSPAEDGAFPAVLMTSYGNEQVAVEAIKAGALDYIVKSPEAFTSMSVTIERAMREWRLLQEKKRVEKQLKESQAQVIQQEKMASIGLLAAGVAHEINNPMGFITSNLGSLGKYIDKLTQFIDFQGQAIERCADEATRSTLADMKQNINLEYLVTDLRELISESLDGSRRVSKIVQDLQSFSRADSIEVVPSDLNETIMRTINMVRNEIKYVAELDLLLEKLPPVVCQPQQIGQVVMNLLMNAAHSINGKGFISLATSRVGDSVEISVTDNGCGILPEHLERIFEPFFTTKEAGRGTGLGLAISHDIVKKHGGELLVESSAGKGTTFTVRLPIDPMNGIMCPKET